jgi:MFS family permease
MKVTPPQIGASAAGVTALPPVATAYGKWGIVLAIGLGTFMSALGESILTTILPAIEDNFHSDVATIEWVIIVYLLVVSGLLLTCGRLGDLYGQKRVYGAGLAVFVLGSALCALAPTVLTLIGLRTIQALGAAALFANAPAILTRHFPARQRGQALSS